MGEDFGIRLVAFPDRDAKLVRYLTQLVRDVKYLVHALHVQVVGRTELLAFLLAFKGPVFPVDVLVADEVSERIGKTPVGASGHVLLPGRQDERRLGGKERHADGHGLDHMRETLQRLYDGP